MRKFWSALAPLALIAAPVAAQSAPEQQPAPEAKPRMVKKTVCQRIEADRETGSRLGSTTKVCKTVEVPAEEKDGKKPQGSQAQGHGAHAY